MTRANDDDAGTAGIVGVPPACGGGGTQREVPTHLWGKWRS